MLRQLTTKRVSAARNISVSRMARIETPNKTDSFKDREHAQEAAYIKKHESEQLKQLKEKLEQQKKAVNDLEKEIKDLKN
ncbi:putative ATPase inhibitor [Clavispora lusitaniae]|uniref:ATPase inhibitor, mitochondrial n=2 Tax=Clavispora lusitaniae TaxID=36911 RepID=A0AA91Q0P3_CLALS|nr:hypothetical protein E0198_001876 [Clavispora lusitaniae]KAF7583729.1 Mitochondrial ATPase inhibitor, IATP family protein [Clavispora lusitaniae]OVF09085.1 putative ATPase inhibitor [Clavispora lusitaniae]QFZ26306.1 putative ATPase inhibitor [Clavispora lusitaniae]QFZ31974.1 putative ATPase inhibitor [Clavispora lusitaniae]